MKAFAGILMMVGMVMSTIVGYHLMVAALPSWLTFWGISVALTYTGFVGSIIAKWDE